MISTEEALSLVLNSVKTFGTETVDLNNCIGRVLAEDVYADRPLPPFDRVTMDGIAIAFDAFERGNRTFPIEAVGAAGSPQAELKGQNCCVEIMTGAILPKGTDTVIRYEDLTKAGDSFIINVEVLQGKNIHRKGSDFNDKSVLLTIGQKLKAVDVNLLATVGRSRIKVANSPNIAVISSGDELVPVDQSPLEYQIRMSNVHMLQARLQELGLPSKHFHIQDDKDTIKATLTSLIDECDVILMSGGVSKGKFDFIPESLESLGVEKQFHRVAQRPGKPFWFGKNDSVTVFAFPGNPVSTLACFHKYFLPWIALSTGKKIIIPEVILKTESSFKPNLTYFAQAKLSFEKGNIFAEIAHGNGSGDLVHPTKMDGFIELPVDKTVFKKGEVYPFIPFHNMLT